MCISILQKGSHKWYNRAQWAGLPREDGWGLGGEGSIDMEWNHFSVSFCTYLTFGTMIMFHRPKENNYNKWHWENST